MRLCIALIELSALLVPCMAGQPAVPDQTSPAGSPATAPPEPVPQAPNSLPPAAFDRPVSWKRLLPNVASDQAHIWSFPVRLAQGRNWVPTIAVLGTTAALVAFDPTEASYFRRTTTFHGFNHVFTGNGTAIGTAAAPVSLYVIGLIRKDSKMEHTALLAGEAIADAEILTTVFKDATYRIRPAGFSSRGNLYDSWFDSRGSLLRGNGSFPSGHAIAAFALATVIARRYGNHRWVPYAAYGMAALVGFSRLSLSAHFLSDVFVGSTLGYAISRFTVLRQ